MTRHGPAAIDAYLLSLGDDVHHYTKERLGERMGVSAVTIRRSLKRLGIEHATRAPRRDAVATEQSILKLGDRIYQMTKAQIGQRIDRSEQAVTDALARLGIKHDGGVIAATQRTIPHGTPSGWSYHKCDCGICLDARREYKRAERQKRLAGFDPTKYEHGVTETYSAGCDCTLCAEAMRSYLLHRNHRTRDTARSTGKRWTGPEVEHVLRDDLTIEQIAHDLGRTYAAVSNVRKSIAAGESRYLVLLGDKSYSLPAWIDRHDLKGRPRTQNPPP